MLLRNIGKALSASSLGYHFETPRGRILIHGDLIRKRSPAWFPGTSVSWMSASVRGQAPGSEDIRGEAVSLASANLRAGMSFAVRAKRQHKTGPDSQELGTLIGSAVYDQHPWPAGRPGYPGTMNSLLKCGTLADLCTIPALRHPEVCHGGRRGGCLHYFHQALIRRSDPC